MNVTTVTRHDDLAHRGTEARRQYSITGLLVDCISCIASGARLPVPLVPWKRDGLPKSWSAAPGAQGAKSALIGHK